MWGFRNVHIAAVHVGTKSDTERKKGWLIGLRWHLERIINQHKVNFTTGITAVRSSGNFVTLDNRTYFWQCHLPVLLYLEITSVNFLFSEHKLYVSSFQSIVSLLYYISFYLGKKKGGGWMGRNTSFSTDFLIAWEISVPELLHAMMSILMGTL